MVVALAACFLTTVDIFFVEVEVALIEVVEVLEVEVALIEVVEALEVEVALLVVVEEVLELVSAVLETACFCCTTAAVVVDATEDDEDEVMSLAPLIPVLP